MQIGLVKEQKNGEMRVALTPNSVAKLIKSGFDVVVESEAGIACGYDDEIYIKQGAMIVDQSSAWESEVIIKVKEPMPSEYELFKENQIIIGFLHLAANLECCKHMIEKNVTAIACENIFVDGEYKLLRPVSEIAGNKSVFIAQQYLETSKNKMLAATNYVVGGKVVILGGGVAGTAASDMAVKLGCEVTILELSHERQAFLKQRYQNQLVTVVDSTHDAMLKAVSDCDALISTILIKGAKAPKIITMDVVRAMPVGSIIVDVAADQGGVVDVEQNITTHADPILDIEGRLLYAVGNIPASVAKTASLSIQGIVDLIVNTKTNITDDASIKTGIEISVGEIINEKIKEIYGAWL